MGRPPKRLEERLVTLSVRIPRTSLELLERIVEGERQYLRQRHLPTHGVHKSAAFRAIWELGEEEYVIQRAVLWVTRRANRYTIEQAATILGWKTETLREILRERGIEPPEPDSPPPPPPAPGEPGPAFDPRFLA